jgi:TM2 domain-containing membrane protein YozV
MVVRLARVRLGTGGLDPDMEQRILDIAILHNGRVTTTTVAHELSVPLRIAEAALSALARAGYVTVDAHAESGAVIYVFPEIDAGLVPMWTREQLHVAAGDALATAPAANGARGDTPRGLVRVSSRSKATAALLAICCGGLGLHKFYLGRPLLGLLYMSMFWTFVPAIAGFFEGVSLLTMSDHAFDMKHNARLV